MGESRGAAVVIPLHPQRPTLEAYARASVAGDEAATRELLLSLLPRVRNLVRYLVRGDAEADDLAQDAMIVILQRLPQFREDGSLKAWADRVVVSVVLDARRRRRRRWALWAAREPVDLEVSGRAEALPDEYLERREAVRLLDGLPTAQRETLVLHYVMGFTVPEVATSLRLPVETVRSRLRLARSSLKAARGGSKRKRSTEVGHE